MLGLSLVEVCYLHDKCAKAAGVAPRDVLCALHFLWRHPTQEAACALFKTSRNTHSDRHWVPVVKLSCHVDEIKMDNRFANPMEMAGSEAFVSLCTDSTDLRVPRQADFKRCFSFKNEKSAHRVAMCVSRTTGDICYVSSAHPAGAYNDISLNRAERTPERVQFFERIGADGTCICRREPVYVGPKRKPRGGELSAEDKKLNDKLGSQRAIVENVFSRVKQWESMKHWRHSLFKHRIAVALVFQLVQVDKSVLTNLTLALTLTLAQP